VTAAKEDAMADIRMVPVEGDDEVAATLDEVVQDGARRMIVAALEAEADEYVASLADEVDDDGRRLVVRNGYAKERDLTVGSGTVRLRAPRVNDKRALVDELTGERQRFCSKILPAYARRSPKATDLLPILYLRAMSTGDFGPALRNLLGENTAGLSASSIQRLTKQWRADNAAFLRRSLRSARYAHLVVGAIHTSGRLPEDDRMCLLVGIGVSDDGERDLIAVQDGYHDSTDSWVLVLRDLKSRGLKAPALVTGDGTLGAWAALGEVFPTAGERRWWVHEIANLLDAGPKHLLPGAKRLPHEPAEAPTAADARAARERFYREFAATYAEAIATLHGDWDALAAFYGFSSPFGGVAGAGAQP
jgi:transposase-like protein